MQTKKPFRLEMWDSCCKWDRYGDYTTLDDAVEAYDGLPAVIRSQANFRVRRGAVIEWRNAQ